MHPSRIEITSVACGKKDEKQAASRDLHSLCKLESHKQFAALLCFFLNAAESFVWFKSEPMNVEIIIVSVFVVAVVVLNQKLLKVYKNLPFRLVAHSDANSVWQKDSNRLSNQSSTQTEGVP